MSNHIPNKIEPINDSSPGCIKRSLKELKIRRGLGCRAIGEAKKNNLPTDNLIFEVEKISKKIKLLEAQLKTSVNQPTLLEGSAPEILPPQFASSQFHIHSHETLKVIDSPTVADWDDYVNRHPNASVYHSSAASKVIEMSFGHPCYYLAVIDEKNKIHGILPLIEMKSLLFGHFLTSLPFFNYGGLLASSKQAEEALFEAASRLAQKLGVNHIEYRNCYPTSNLPVRSDKVTMLLSLPNNTELLWDKIGTKIRAQIKKCERHSPVTKIGKDELVDDFYEVFSRNMRDLGTPVYSRDFFYNTVRCNSESTIVVIYLNDTPVSAAFLLGWRNTIEIPWASTIRSANKYDANMKLYWETLRLAIERRYEVFDFGRSSIDGSTYKFKKQWGASPRPLHWQYWLRENQEIPQINPKNPKYAFFSTAWKYLPLYIANKLGPEIVKNIP